MNLIEIPIVQLEAHPLNSNVMPQALMEKLAAHIARTGRYPPVIVREIVESAGSEALAEVGDEPPLPPRERVARSSEPGEGEPPKPRAGAIAPSAPRYQILDGHHRVEALRRSGETIARCVVWDVDDAEALTLLATLNRLQGQDDPKKRARLIEAISHARGVAFVQLSRELPERGEQLRALSALNDAPRVLPPREVDDLPVAVHFFLKREDQRRLESRLREMGGSREAALMRLVGDSPTHRSGWAF